MTLLMQGSGALAIFLIGLICLMFFRFMFNSKSIWKILVLWLSFHGLIQSIPQVMVSYFDSGTDVGEALIGYLHLSQSLLLILAIISIIAIAMISIWFSRQFLEFASDDLDMTNSRTKIKYIQYIAVGAAIIGSILVVPFRVMPIHHAITPFIIFVFSIPWVWSAAAISKPIKPSSNKINKNIYWGPILLLVFSLIFFRLILTPGLKF